MENLELHISNVSPVWPHLLETVSVKGEGTHVWDKSGRRYLDFTSGTDDNVVRWIPPLVIDEAQLSEALAIFGRALETG